MLAMGGGSTKSKAENLGPGPAPGQVKDAPANLDDAWDSIDGPAERPITVVVIGCGHRGKNYSSFSLDFPSRMKVVAIVEPEEHRRNKFKERYSLPDDKVFEDWPALADCEKIADAALICTQDRQHRDPALAFARKGYHLLLEKPMSVSERECDEIAAACKEAGVMMCVCHVLRYFPPCVKIREVIDSGVLGDIVTIDHRENILYWHFAHSFVRGNWRQEATSSFSLLAKSIHDMDLIMYWMGDKKCTKIHSVGGLYNFKPEKQPEGAGDRCFDCPSAIEEKCPYSARKIYLDRNAGHPHWPMSAVCDIEDHPKGYTAALREALETGPYGKCVYKTDNDVCDHQVVSMEFESGATASFTMNAFTKDMRRETRIAGTMGELRWDGSAQGALILYEFNTNKETRIMPDLIAPPCQTAGHGGADFFMVNSFCKAVAKNDPSLISSDIDASLRSHKLCFVAERSRLQGSVEHPEL